MRDEMKNVNEKIKQIEDLINRFIGQLAENTNSTNQVSCKLKRFMGQYVPLPLVT